MKRGLIVGAIIFVLVVILVIIFYPSREEIPLEASCKINSECVKFENSCCSCSNGGTAYSVNKDYVEEVKSKINTACSQVSNFCPMSEGFRSRCNLSVKCWGGMCGFEDHNPREIIVN